MKVKMFKSFKVAVAVAERNDPIWCMGWAFLQLTDKQVAEIYDVLVNNPNCHIEEIRGHKAIVTPTGISLWKGEV